MRTTTPARTPLTTAEADAAAVLDQAWLPLDAAGALPVDPLQIAWRMGVQVKARKHRGWIGSLTVKPGAPPVVFADDRHEPIEGIYTCTHLFGHYIGRVGAGDTEFTLRCGRRELGLDDHPEEGYANRFADALLMPAEAVEAAGTLNVAVLAARFEVPPYRVIARLTALGLR